MTGRGSWVTDPSETAADDAPDLFDVLEEACRRYLDEGAVPEPATLSMLCWTLLDFIAASKRRPGRLQRAAEHAELMFRQYLAAGIEHDAALELARGHAARMWGIESRKSLAGAHRYLTKKK